jgi:hypothetical protein
MAASLHEECVSVRESAFVPAKSCYFLCFRVENGEWSRKNYVIVNGLGKALAQPPYREFRNASSSASPD